MRGGLDTLGLEPAGDPPAAPSADPMPPASRGLARRRMDSSPLAVPTYSVKCVKQRVKLKARICVILLC
jgi:hypothetical protein